MYISEHEINIRIFYYSSSKWGGGIQLKLECRGMRISCVFWRSGRNGTLSLEQSATGEWLDMNLEKAADFRFVTWFQKCFMNE